jgi:hypothetical protein
MLMAVAKENLMEASGERQILVHQLHSLGVRAQTLADAMDAKGGVDAERLQDLQSLIAELTDAANELEQYANTSG